MNIYKLKIIETPRLLIRPVQLGDEIQMNQAINRSLDAIQRWMPWAQDPSLETTKEFISQSVTGWQTEDTTNFCMAVIHKQDNKIIAATGFNEMSDLTKPFFEIGYWIDSDYAGQGLVTEAVIALSRFALDELNATRVQITTQVGNIKSANVALRCGYIKEAILKNNCVDCVSNKPSDSFIFACCDSALVPPLDVTIEQDFDKQAIELAYVEIESSENPIELPILQTERLELTPPRFEDLHLLHDALMDSLNEVSPWFSWATSSLTSEDLARHIDESIQAAQDIFAHDHLFYLVWDHKNEDLLGEVWLKINEWDQAKITLNYWFNSEYSEQGYATEAISALIHYAFDTLKARRLQLHIAETNLKSMRLAKRLGFDYEGSLQNHSKNYITNEIMRTEVFAMTQLN